MLDLSMVCTGNQPPMGLAHNRQGGRILGDYRRRYAEPNHVPILTGPALPTDQPSSSLSSADAPSSEMLMDADTGSLGAPPYGVGPHNPSRQLDDTWAAYWDDQAGAVYYFREDTGEASWIPPL